MGVIINFNINSPEHVDTKKLNYEKQLMFYIRQGKWELTVINF